MDCGEVLERLSAYLEVECPSALSTASEAHLERCRDCRFEVDTLRRTIGVDRQSDETASAERCLDDALQRLRQEYFRSPFFQERDLVFTVQQMMMQGCPPGLRVFNDFPVVRGLRRALTADLALVDLTGRPRLVVEFKYEPDHRRGGPGGDIWPSKLNPSVVFWGAEGVCGDIERVQRFVSDGVTDRACSLFFDEGGHFRGRVPPSGATWEDWRYPGEDRTVSVLACRVKGA
jgi:hypothetical protein